LFAWDTDKPFPDKDNWSPARFAAGLGQDLLNVKTASGFALYNPSGLPVKVGLNVTLIVCATFRKAACLDAKGVKGFAGPRFETGTLGFILAHRCPP
jgi:hypothetical protein